MTRSSRELPDSLTGLPPFHPEGDDFFEDDYYDEYGEPAYEAWDDCHDIEDEDDVEDYDDDCI